MITRNLALVFTILLGTAALGWQQRPATAQSAASAKAASTDNQLTELAEAEYAKRFPTAITETAAELYQRAEAQLEALPRYELHQGRLQPRMEENGQNNWTELGPSNVGGRTRAFVIQPNNPNVLYAAAAGGGVWKSLNGGAAWQPINNGLANLAVVALAQDKNNPNVLYAGTGESAFFAGVGRGSGIFKTTDGGASWQRLPTTTTTDFFAVSDLLISSQNSQRLYATTNTGVWRSLDGGGSWERVFNQPDCLDLVGRSDQTGDVVFTACGTRNSQGRVYRNTDAGGAGEWQSVLAEQGMGRTTLALAPSNQNVIYAVAASPASNPLGFHAVYRSTNGGASGSWTTQVRGDNANRLNTVLLAYPNLAFASVCGTGVDTLAGVGWYANAVAVDPLDPQRVWVGGVDLFRSDDGGANWGLASYWHADRSVPQSAPRFQHALQFHPGYDGATNKALYVAGEGGLLRTDDARATVATGPTAACHPANSAVHWTRLDNGYRTTLFGHGVVAADGKSWYAHADGRGLLAGTEAGGSVNWQLLLNGDPGRIAVDPVASSVVYAAVSSSVFKSSNGGRSFVSARNFQTFDSGSLSRPPLTVDPSDGARLWTGGRYLWRSNDGTAHWEPVMALPSGFGSISAVAVSPLDSSAVIVGTTTGAIYRPAQALDFSTLFGVPGFGGAGLSGLPRQGFVSWLTFDPQTTDVVYATYSSFGGKHVWRSVDGGATWSSLDGDTLPDVPVHCLVVDPLNSQRLFIGTDLGIFVSADGGASWGSLQTGFGNVPTLSLASANANGTTWLYAFTYGRGAWRVELGNTPCSYTLSASRVKVAANGGGPSVQVTAPEGCMWTANLNPSANGFVTLTNGANGSGNGIVQLSVAPNTSPATRTGTVAIAGRSFAIEQAGVSDNLPPTIQITQPTNGASFTTTQTFINLAGTASDNVAVEEITWTMDRGANNFPFSDKANGKSTWTVANLPLQPGVNTVTMSARDTSGNTQSATLQINFLPTATILTIAGTGSGETPRDNVPARFAPLHTAQGLCVDETGNIYIADHLRDRVYKIDARTGLLTTVVGGGNSMPGDGGPATNARLVLPTAVVRDAAGNLYIADFGQDRIRQVKPDGTISTVAGNGCFIRCSLGDGGPATQAAVVSPTDIKLDQAGNLYIAEMRGNRVRRVDAVTGIITTIAGTEAGSGTGSIGDNGPANLALLGGPRGLAFDNAGNLYISEERRVRRVDAATGIITTVVGPGAFGTRGDGGPATQAYLSPSKLVFDQQGNLFISDALEGRVRKVDAGTGVITTVAGGGTARPGHGGPPIAATISPGGLAFDLDSNLLIGGLHYVYKVIPYRLSDSQGPNLAINEPTTQSRYTSTTSGLPLAGLATDNRGLTHITWRNDRGGGGIANYNPSNIIKNWDAQAALQPGLNNLVVTAWDTDGNSSSARLTVSYSPANIAKLVAGVPVVQANRAAFNGDGIAAHLSPLANPQAVAFDAAGNLFIADSGNQRIRRIGQDGLITTVAGNGLRDFSGDGGPATAAALNEPQGLAVDANGNLYIADTNNHCVRRVSPTGVITTVAGTGAAGFSGDGGLGSNAQLSFPIGLALDASSNLYIADTNNHRIRKLTSNGILSTLAGNGFADAGANLGDGGPATAARLNSPRAVAFDANGLLYIADSGNQRIRFVSASGGIGTYLSGQPPASFSFFPVSLAFDSARNLYIGDGNSNRILKVGTDRMINAIAGVFGFSTPDHQTSADALNVSISPAGLVVERGNLYIADARDNRVLLIAPQQDLFNVNAASYSASALAPESIAVVFGVNLATTTRAATTTPLPTELAGTSVRVRDRTGLEKLAPLFFVSPTQINYQVPVGLLSGPATVSVVNGQGQLSSGPCEIAALAPGLFTANASGQGVAAGALLRSKADGTQSFEPLAFFDQQQQRFVARPLEFGALPERLFVLLFGTGLRQRSALANVTAVIGDSDSYENVPVSFAGPQGNLVGLDQINLELPRSLARNRGVLDVILTIDGQTLPSVKIFPTGPNCQNSVTLSASTFGATGGAGSATISASANCFWAVMSRASWLSLNGATQGNGNAMLNFTVAPNPTSFNRTAQLNLAGLTFTVTQAGNSPPPTLTVANVNNGGVTASLPTATLNGTATGNPALAFVAWSDTRGILGLAQGTTNWTLPIYGFRPGTNPVTVTVYDTLGRSVSTSITVNYQPEFILSTIAGRGQSAPSNGTVARDVSFGELSALVFDTAGNLYVGTNTQIWRINPAGVLSLVAGDGGFGSGADNIPAAQTTFRHISGLAFDTSGNLYCTDAEDGRVRKITLATGVITTVAGSLNGGSQAENIPATTARLFTPADLAFDANNNLYLVEAGAHRIRRVAASTGLIATIAGNGRQVGPLGDGGPALQATIDRPQTLALDRDGKLYIGSSTNGRVRRIDLATGLITTLAGGGEAKPGEGLAANTVRLTPYSISVDSAGNVYLADFARVFRVPLTTGRLSTIAGTGVFGFMGDGVPALEADLSAPNDFAFDASGNVYWVEAGAVRKLTRYQPQSN